MPDALTIGMIIAAFAMGGFIKGAIGMGLPVIVLTLLAMIMPLKSAMAIFLIPGVVANLWQATSGPYLPGLIRRLWPYLLAAIVGIALGVFTTADTPTETMVMILGLMLIVYSVFSLAGPRLPAPGRHERWMSPLAGGLGGIVFGMVGVFIIPGLLYLEALRLPRDQMVQGMGLTFVTISSALAVSMTGVNLVTGELALLSALGLIPAFAGIWLGQRIRHRIPEAFYRKLFFIALIFSGVYMVAKAWGVFE